MGWQSRWCCQPWPTAGQALVVVLTTAVSSGPNRIKQVRLTLAPGPVVLKQVAVGRSPQQDLKKLAVASCPLWEGSSGWQVFVDMYSVAPAGMPGEVSSCQAQISDTSRPRALLHWCSLPSPKLWLFSPTTSSSYTGTKRSPASLT